MTKTSLIARTILVAGTFLLGFPGMDAAMAAPPAGGAPAARILTIDLRRVMSESKVGQDMLRQAEALKLQATGELRSEGESLRRDQAELQQQAAILAADVKNRRIKDFEAKRDAFQVKVQKRGGLIQGGYLKAQQQVEQALGPILEGVMHERGATILIDRSSVLLAPNAIDVTQIVEQRLDVKLSSVKVQLTELPAGAQQQQQQQR